MGRTVRKWSSVPNANKDEFMRMFDELTVQVDGRGKLLTRIGLRSRSLLQYWQTTIPTKRHIMAMIKIGVRYLGPTDSQNDYAACWLKACGLYIPDTKAGWIEFWENVNVVIGPSQVVYSVKDLDALVQFCKSQGVEEVDLAEGLQILERIQSFKEEFGQKK